MESDLANVERRVSAVAAIPIHRRLADTRAAIDALNTGTRAWTTFTPNVASVDAAIAQADAVARSLRELRPVIAQEFAFAPPPKAA